MTLKERAIQTELFKIARAEEDKGKKTKVGYRMITIHGEIYYWDDKEEWVKQAQSKKLFLMN